MTNYIIEIRWAGGAVDVFRVAGTSQRNALKKVKILLSKDKRQTRRAIKRIVIAESDE